MNPIIDLIHSVDRVSISVAWSPNIMIRYFIHTPFVGAAVGALTTGSEPPSGSRHPTRGNPRRRDEHRTVPGSAGAGDLPDSWILVLRSEPDRQRGEGDVDPEPTHHQHHPERPLDR